MKMVLQGREILFKCSIQLIIGFKKECILDIERVRSFEEGELSGQRIEIMGTIPHHELRQIYEKIKTCRKIYNKVKEDIFFSFLDAGISGLKHPKK